MTGMGRKRTLGRKPFVCDGIVYSEAKRVRELLSHIDSDPADKFDESLSFLVRDGFVTGTVLDVDGGARLM